MRIDVDVAAGISAIMPLSPPADSLSTGAAGGQI